MIIAETTTNVKGKYLKNSGAQHKSCMTKESVLLMEERRKQKNSSQTHKTIQRDIQRTIREAKQKELNQKCQETEVFQRRFDQFNLHKKARDVPGKF